MGPVKHPAAGKPRGLLKADAPVGKFHHARLLPSAEVAPFVEHYWIVHWDLLGHAPLTRETLPHPSIHVILEQGRSGVAGVTTGKFTRVLEGCGRVFGIKFRPGGFRGFVNSAVADFTNRVTPLHEIFGEDGPQLEARVLALETDQQQVEAAERFIRERLPARDEAGELAAKIAERAA